MICPSRFLADRMIRAGVLREDQVDSFNSLGVIPSLFPMHTFYWGDWHREHTVGPKLSNNISPTGWCVERGMRFTTHHDAPVAFPDSMRVLSATVTRRSRSGDIIGPAGNYSTLNDTAKWVLSAAMLIGRLELMAVYVILTVSFWRA